VKDRIDQVEAKNAARDKEHWHETHVVALCEAGTATAIQLRQCATFSRRAVQEHAPGETGHQEEEQAVEDDCFGNSTAEAFTEKRQELEDPEAKIQRATRAQQEGRGHKPSGQVEERRLRHGKQTCENEF
jgi:hypothetical protein